MTPRITELGLNKLELYSVLGIASSVN